MAVNCGIVRKESGNLRLFGIILFPMLPILIPLSTRFIRLNKPDVRTLLQAKRIPIKLEKSSLPSFNLLSIPGSALKLDSQYIIGLNISTESGFGYNELLVRTNSPPRGGYCSLEPKIGVAFETQFQATCRDWTDEQQPVVFHISHESSGSSKVIYYGSEESVKFALPPGDEKNDWKLKIEFSVIDMLGYNISTCPIWVKSVLKPGSWSQEKRLSDFSLYEGVPRRNIRSGSMKSTPMETLKSLVKKQKQSAAYYSTLVSTRMSEDIRNEKRVQLINLLGQITPRSAAEVVQVLESLGGVLQPGGIFGEPLLSAAMVFRRASIIGLGMLEVGECGTVI